jgi:hypothetical protein
MHVPINVKSPNNIRKWQVGFNSAFKGLRRNKIKMNTTKTNQKLIPPTLTRKKLELV